MSIPTVDARMLDTDWRWEDYRRRRGIKNPFTEDMLDFQERCSYEADIYGHIITHIRLENEEEKARREEREKYKSEYQRLEHTFRLWDFHFWMEWARFKKHLEWSTDLADTSIYMPCDAADRQCSMTCAYFGEKCPRIKEELKIPQILGFDGRWEEEDDYRNEI